MWINFTQNLPNIGSIFAKIKTINYNGKECYIIKRFTSSSLTFEGTETYIEKSGYKLNLNCNGE